jgi:hypothetical protein
MAFEHIKWNDPHPIIALPDASHLASLSPEDLEIFKKQRLNLLVAEKVDPLRYGYEPEVWKLADQLLSDFRKKNPVGPLLFIVLGGIRASKTEWRCKGLIRNMLRKPNYVGWACHTTQTSSFDAQQKKIHRYIPAEFKKESGRNRQGTVLKVNYTPWGGFTTDNFALPDKNGTASLCLFKYYGIDPKALEGSEIDEGWMDEEAPVAWLDALLDRAVTRNGIVYLTFTAKSGYTILLRSILSGAKTLQEVDAELLPGEKVPRVQINENVELRTGADNQNKTIVKAMIVYFHTSDNPYGNYEGLKERLKGASRETILTRAYGIPTKSAMTNFPNFRDNPHIISLNRFREIQKGGGVWYHFLDPCSGRNWFQIWIFIDPLNRAFVVGESPSHGHKWAYIPGVGDPGPWAIAGNKMDGDQGDGQKEWGWGYDRYLEEMDRMERLLSGGLSEGNGVTDVMQSSPSAQKIEISARWIDARYGNARKTTEERSTTLIEDLEQKGMIFLAAPSEKYIDGGRGGGDGSLRMINDRLYYNTEKEIDHTNQPKLYVVETCPNVIMALKDWTGQDGQHGALKDPIDVLRMFVLSKSEYVDPALLQPRTPWLDSFPRR